MERGEDDQVQRLTSDPTKVTLEQWLASRGTRTGTFTINGVTYTDFNEVEWRRANNIWRRPQ
ncbi:hypothetical protein [Dactylosporangium sp. NPDC050588]|uniref:hypothetical protein n=1 Tax=Dactylosporangium sp. NPDC050588 TaxID=3157211 RepID=UPI00341037D0